MVKLLSIRLGAASMVTIMAAHSALGVTSEPAETDAALDLPTCGEQLTTNYYADYWTQSGISCMGSMTSPNTQKRRSITHD